MAEALHRKLATDAFESHVVTELSRNGVYRSWRCGSPNGSSIYSFTITTIPGHIIVTGDVGDLIISRLYDMLPWCRRSIDSASYLAEKVPHAIPTKVFSHDEVKRWAREQLGDPDCPDEHKPEYESLLSHCDEVSEGELYESTYELWGGGDPPDWREWNANFLWCREAIRWFLEHHEEPEVCHV